jgi:serine/threonine-protein kinase HipA
VLGHGKNITREHLIKLGEKAGMKRPDTINVIENARAAISKWKVFAGTYGVGRQSTHMVAAALVRVSI